MNQSEKYMSEVMHDPHLEHQNVSKRRTSLKRNKAKFFRGLGFEESDQSIRFYGQFDEDQANINDRDHWELSR